jgi:hypothetical protein
MAPNKRWCEFIGERRHFSMRTDQTLMKKLELFVHLAHCADPKQLAVADDASAEEFIIELQRAGLFQHEVGEETLVFLDNHDEPLEQKHQLRDCGVGNRHLLHCHTCRRVEVKVHYNGAGKERPFPPSARISRVLRWAAGAFGLTGTDAQGLELRLQCDASQALPTDSHVGCYTRPHQCALELCLVPKVRVEG